VPRGIAAFEVVDELEGERKRDRERVREGESAREREGGSERERDERERESGTLLATMQPEGLLHPDTMNPLDDSLDNFCLLGHFGAVISDPQAFFSADSYDHPQDQRSQLEEVGLLHPDTMMPLDDVAFGSVGTTPGDLGKNLAKAGDKLMNVWDLNDLKDDTLEMQEHVGEDIKENVEKHVRGFVAAAGKYT
jgi:hypothetical protein